MNIFCCSWQLLELHHHMCALCPLQYHWLTLTSNTSPGWWDFTFHLATTSTTGMDERSKTVQISNCLKFLSRGSLTKPPISVEDCQWDFLMHFLPPLCTIFHQTMQISSSSQGSSSIFFDLRLFLKVFKRKSVIKLNYPNMDSPA